MQLSHLSLNQSLWLHAHFRFWGHRPTHVYMIFLKFLLTVKGFLVFLWQLSRVWDLDSIVNLTFPLNQRQFKEISSKSLLGKISFRSNNICKHLNFLFFIASFFSLESTKIIGISKSVGGSRLLKFREVRMWIITLYVCPVLQYCTEKSLKRTFLPVDRMLASSSFSLILLRCQLVFISCWVSNLLALFLKFARN